ncbi:hypothetical protein [Ekhidna sp.]
MKKQLTYILLITAIIRIGLTQELKDSNKGYLQKIGKKYNSLIIKTLQPL